MPACADPTAPETCGTCDQDCYAELLNVPPALVACDPGAMPGFMRGTCMAGGCAPNHHDLDRDGSCETYCVKVSVDDASCDGLDSDCDGTTDEDVSLCDLAHCGGCNNPCVIPNGMPMCVCTGNMGACAVGACRCTGTGDCFHDADGDASNGCEYRCDPTPDRTELCDGLDNDCDGRVDEADDDLQDTRLGVTCNGGVDGVCAAAEHRGVTACVGGRVACTGPDVILPGTLRETCNSRDDDCDGLVDDTTVEEGTACGSSSNAPCRMGQNACENGQVVCRNAVEPSAELCNGVDDDCDGAVDMAQGQPAVDVGGPCNVPVPPPPGATSACMAGAWACVDGQRLCMGSSGPSGPLDTCGVDANCDGALTLQPNTSNDVSHCGACGNNCLAGAVHAAWSCASNQCIFQGCEPGYHDNGGPGDAVAGDQKCGYACVFRQAQEMCNGVDDNCDGQVDENPRLPPVPAACGASPAATAAECTTGVQVSCVDGAPRCTFPSGVCNPTCATAAETPADGLDNNCNGLTDTDAASVFPEVCDGCDNDHDGVTDDGVASVACGLALPANCAGVLSCGQPQNVPPGQCAPFGSWGICTNNPLPEVCDGVDNNCNGVADDDVPSVNCVPPGTPPGLVYGAVSRCRMGRTSCVNGVTVCVGWVGPAAEVCNGVDDNCDGNPDNNVPGAGQACGISTPPCSAGATGCINGAWVCQGGVAPQPERCDGVDNNCNGTVDDGPLADAPPEGMNGCWNTPGNCCSFGDIQWCPPIGATCNGAGPLAAPCGAGRLSCASGGWTCTGDRAPTAERCDGVDNNCNGVPDDGVLPGVGDACTAPGTCGDGLLQCTEGALVCSALQLAMPETCDAADNNCNGQDDEGFNVGAACTAPVDPDLYPGNRNHGACVSGVLSCTAEGGTACVNATGPEPETCDGQDNDCDGQVDEAGAAPDGVSGTVNPMDNTVVIGAACGTGACAGGTWSCRGGAFACVGGGRAGTEQCNGVDDDCDGVVDLRADGSVPCEDGSACVRHEDAVRCAVPCAEGPRPCPTGQVCVDAVAGAGPAGRHCWPAP